jgi:hypothetical protein
LNTKNIRVLMVATGTNQRSSCSQKVISSKGVAREVRVEVGENTIILIATIGDVPIDETAMLHQALLKSMVMTHDLPKTLTTRTPTGGRHLYYRSAVAVPNGVDILGAGLDVRSDRGYVVAPGSEVDAGRPVEVHAIVHAIPIPISKLFQVSFDRFRALLHFARKAAISRTGSRSPPLPIRKKRLSLWTFDSRAGTTTLCAGRDRPQ